MKKMFIYNSEETDTSFSDNFENSFVFLHILM